MPIAIFHGNGLSAISQATSKIKQGFDPLSIIQMSGRSSTWNQARLALASGDLFAGKRLVILEDFEPDFDLAKLTLDDQVTLVLRFAKTIPATSLTFKSVQSLKVQISRFEEKDEVSVFPFLDDLADQKHTALVKLEELLEEYGGQYILTMIFYLLRRMVYSPKKLPPFIAQKIARQKMNFPKEKISELYRQALGADFKIKSGLIEDRLGLLLVAQNFLKA